MPRRSEPHPLALAIGARVRLLRLELGLTAERFAYERFGSKGYLSDIEHGLALPSLQTLDALAQALEVDLVDLFTAPERDLRGRLIDRTRQLSAPTLRRLLAILDEDETPEGEPAPAAIRASTLLPMFTELDVAAGQPQQRRAANTVEELEVRLPGDLDPVECFAARASGRSMEGWRRQIRSGDWLVFRWSRVGLAAAAGRIALVAHRDREGDMALQVKRVVARQKRIVLASDNPEYPATPVTRRHELFGLFVAAHSPASLGPKPDTWIAEGSVGESFGLARDPGRGWSRVEGHLFALLESEAITPVVPKGKGSRKQQRLKPALRLTPAETAYVLVAEEAGWRYLGVAAALEPDLLVLAT